MVPSQLGWTQSQPPLQHMRSYVLSQSVNVMVVIHSSEDSPRYAKLSRIRFLDEWDPTERHCLEVW